MVVGVDVDGVLRNFADSFDRFCLDLYGKKRTTWENYDLDKRSELTEEEWQYLVWDRFAFPILAGAEPYPGALRMLYCLKALGVEVAVVTYQPTPKAKAATWEWLRLKFRDGNVHARVLDLVDHVIMLGGEFRRSELAKSGISLDVHLDDEVNNVLSFAEKGKIGVLFTRPWNENVEGAFTRVESHMEFVRLVEGSWRRGWW